MDIMKRSGNSKGFHRTVLVSLAVGLGAMVLSRPAEASSVSARADFAWTGVSYQVFTSRAFTRRIGNTGVLSGVAGVTGTAYLCTRIGLLAGPLAPEAGGVCAFVVATYGPWLISQAKASANAGNCLMMEFIPLSPRAWSSPGYWVHFNAAWAKLRVLSYGGRYCSDS
jgi:hypothetical protein